MIAISNAENFHLATFFIKFLFWEIPDGFRFEALDVVVTESDKASFASVLNSSSFDPEENLHGDKEALLQLLLWFYTSHPK